MKGIYLLMILEILIYKGISRFIFLTNTYSSDKEDVSTDLKKWNFSFYHILYYAVTIIAILKPIITTPIELSYFLLGLIPVCTSLFLIFVCNITKRPNYVEVIDFLFMEGLSIQINSWLCSLIGFIYLIIQIVVLSIKKRMNK